MITQVFEKPYAYRRSENEIKASILTVLSRRGPTLITHLQVAVNSSYPVLKRYVSELVENELIKENDRNYFLTEKGALTIQAYRFFLENVLPK